MGAVEEKISELIRVGWNVKDWEQYNKWKHRVSAFLSQALPTEADRFGKVGADPYLDWSYLRESKIGMLEALAARLGDADSAVESLAAAAGDRVSPTPRYSNRVFVVHGRDNEAKESVARFLERLGLEPIILHEQANEGLTVIEKFERHADVRFAVVLLTPDDVGGLESEPDKLQPRARQNVVLELGYFLGSLKRSRVCALYKAGVEIPSDYQGVLYVELDGKGAWRTSLAQELSNAGLKIDLEALLKS